MITLEIIASKEVVSCDNCSRRTSSCDWRHTEQQQILKLEIQATWTCDKWEHLTTWPKWPKWKWWWIWRKEACKIHIARFISWSRIWISRHDQDKEISKETNFGYFVKKHQENLGNCGFFSLTYVEKTLKLKIKNPLFGTNIRQCYLWNGIHKKKEYIYKVHMEYRTPSS